MYDEEEVRRRVHDEVDSLTDSQLRTFERSRKSLEAWIYKAAKTIGRILSAPIRWIANIFMGLLDGLFSN